MSAFRCAFCDIDYDVIGKMETFDADFLYYYTPPASRRNSRRPARASR